MVYKSPPNSKTSVNILTSLRRLVPAKYHTVQEAYDIAALQAKKFRELSDCTNPDFLYEVINGHPKIFIAYDPNLPVYGSAHWNGKTWIIVLDSSETRFRQRFNLAHEFKHILDHTYKHYLYPSSNMRTSPLLAESIADYFAFYLLNIDQISS
jgi:hypothetical protein